MCQHTYHVIWRREKNKWHVEFQAKSMWNFLFYLERRKFNVDSYYNYQYNFYYKNDSYDILGTVFTGHIAWAYIMNSYHQHMVSTHMIDADINFFSSFFSPSLVPQLPHRILLASRWALKNNFCFFPVTIVVPSERKTLKMIWHSSLLQSLGPQQTKFF